MISIKVPQIINIANPTTTGVITTTEVNSAIAAITAANPALAALTPTIVGVGTAVVVITIGAYLFSLSLAECEEEDPAEYVETDKTGKFLSYLFKPGYINYYTTQDFTLPGRDWPEDPEDTFNAEVIVPGPAVTFFDTEEVLAFNNDQSPPTVTLVESYVNEDDTVPFGCNFQYGNGKHIRYESDNGTKDFFLDTTYIRYVGTDDGGPPESGSCGSEDINGVLPYRIFGESPNPIFESEFVDVYLRTFTPPSTSTEEFLYRLESPSVAPKVVDPEIPENRGKLYSITMSVQVGRTISIGNTIKFRVDINIPIVTDTFCVNFSSDFEQHISEALANIILETGDVLLGPIDYELNQIGNC